MNYLLILAMALAWILTFAGGWPGWQLLRQNGRLLLRLDDLEQRLAEVEFDDSGSSRREETLSGNSDLQIPKSEIDQSLVTSAATGRFGNRSLVRSKIDRNGLKAGTIAPNFCLPRLNGDELSLEELRGKQVLLVFSDPHCGACNALAPQLEKLHREQPDMAVVMISRGEPKDNRAKVKEHGLTFLIVLQQRWEISRRYAMFATPIGYLIDEAGIIVNDVAVGTEAILNLVIGAKQLVPG